MSKSQAWVLGGGGLLGGHILEAFAEEAPDVVVWGPGLSRIPWQEPAQALAVLSEQATRFAREVAEGSGEWMVLWCAGAGVVGSRAEDLARETAYLTHLMDLLGQLLPDRPGRVLLASSAGGVYGNSRERPLTEFSTCSPISEYGRNKLQQERLVCEWAKRRPRVSTLIARISNLYGPGQNLAKPQGLITHISRSLLHHTPVCIYVPLDTVRDYVYAGDCARHLLRALLRVGQTSREDVLKIFHAGETTTIAGVIAAFSRIAKGHPRIICSADSTGSLQPLHLHFRTTVWTDLVPPQHTDLTVGIQRTHSHLLSLFQRGMLPPASHA